MGTTASGGGAPGRRGAARARGLGVYVWTVNDEARRAELIALGASGVITDRPDVLREVERRRP